MKRTKTLVVSIVIIIYLLGIVPRQVAVAQEATPPPDGQEQSTDPSPSPDPSPTPDPSPSPLPSEALAQEGDPCTPDCLPAGEAGPPTVVDQTNDATVDNNVSDTADTGNNTINPSPLPSSEPSASPSPDPTEEAIGPEGSDPQIDTGDAVAQVDLVNEVNTNLVNSDASYQVENIYVDENGDIDLTQNGQEEAQPSAVLIVTQDNTADVNNVVVAIANTGQNAISGMAGEIQTGTAYVVVNIINFINSNLINSSWQFVVINIFGNLTGNIILPEQDPPPAGESGPAILGDVSQSNTADIQNNIDSSANTGGNTLAGSGAITTGDATSVVNLQNFANTNLIGGVYHWLIINNFGNWAGNFLGWGTLDAQSPSYGSMILSFDSAGLLNGSFVQSGSWISADQTNQATLNNQITASANSGDNSIDGSGAIRTGNAFSIVNVINFVNANVINSRGFFGIINIFGSLTGDIGGQSYFATTQNTDSAIQSQNQDQPEVRITGGELETSMTTNVGTHVNPGDTLMFFIDAKNPGSGPVYDSQVIFNLYDANDQLASVQTFNIGKLNPGETAKISFGLVLADTAPAGIYYALAQAEGKVGPDNQQISSQSETSFRVGLIGGLLSGIIPEVQAAETVGAGATPLTAEASPVTNPWWMVYMALGILGMTYILYRLSKPSYRFILLYRRRKDKRLSWLISFSASKLSAKALAFKSWFFEL